MEELYDKELLGKGFQKQKFNFSVKEFSKLSSYDAVQQAGQFATKVIENYLNTTILPRCGVVPNPEVKLLYDLTEGNFTVWVPVTKETTDKEAVIPAPAQPATDQEVADKKDKKEVN